MSNGYDDGNPMDELRAAHVAMKTAVTKTNVEYIVGYETRLGFSGSEPTPDEILKAARESGMGSFMPRYIEKRTEYSDGTDTIEPIPLP